MSKPIGLLHLNLHVTNIYISQHFYQQVFGYVLITEISDKIMLHGHPVFMKQVVMGIPGASDLLTLSELAGQSVREKGLGHFGIVVGDDQVATLTKKVESFGGTILHNGIRKVKDIRESFTYISDPDGYAIEISSYKTFYAQDFRQLVVMK
jgi:extradiol dioxygenase family protein